MNHRYPTKLPRVPAGNTRETTWFLDARKCLDERSIIAGPGILVDYTVGGTVLKLAPARTAAAEAARNLQRMYVDGVSNDYLECRKSDEAGQPIGALGQATIYVAKPKPLRVTTYHNQSEVRGGVLWLFQYADSNNRNLTPIGGTTYVSEALFPQYVVGDNEIYAMQPIGKTGLTVHFETGNIQLEWIDMNVSARVFVPAYTRVPICVVVNGVNTVQYMFVAGGPIQAV